MLPRSGNPGRRPLRVGEICRDFLTACRSFVDSLVAKKRATARFAETVCRDQVALTPTFRR